jgi:elongation factor P
MSYPSDLRPGDAVTIDETPYVVVGYEHQKLGRGSATIRLRLKNLKTGAIADRTFKGKEDLEDADVAYEQAHYLNRQSDTFVFMDQSTSTQLEIPAQNIGEAAKFLKEGEAYEVVIINDEPINVKLPPKVVLKVTEAEPGLKGDTAQSPSKRAILETGASVQVPLFVKAGDSIRINTETGQYVERV